jgi:ribose transport system permease protein
MNLNKMVLSRNNSASTSFGEFAKDKIGILLGLFVLCVVLSFLSPYFLTTDNILNVLRQICTNTIIAFGMTFVIISGGIDLSVGSIMAVVAIMTTAFIADMGLPVPFAVILGLGIGVLFGLFNGILVSKAKMAPFIVTLASSSIARGIAYIYSGGRPIRVSDTSFSMIGSGFIGPISLPIIYMIAIFVVLSIVMYKTIFARHVFAIGGNRIAAEFSGVKIAKVEINVYILSGFLAAFAGLVISSRMFTGQPTIGNGAELDAIAATVIGGTSFNGGSGSLIGALIGSLLIGILNNGLNIMNVDSFWQEVLKGIVIICAVYFDSLRDKNKR